MAYASVPIIVRRAAEQTQQLSIRLGKEGGYTALAKVRGTSVCAGRGGASGGEDGAVSGGAPGRGVEPRQGELPLHQGCRCSETIQRHLRPKVSSSLVGSPKRDQESLA